MGMENNIGATDRTVRLALGGVLAAFGVAVFAGALDFGPIAGGAAVAVGAILFVTGATSMCPIYRVLGVDTCRTQ